MAHPDEISKITQVQRKVRSKSMPRLHTVVLLVWSFVLSCLLMLKVLPLVSPHVDVLFKCLLLYRKMMYAAPFLPQHHC